MRPVLTLVLAILVAACWATPKPAAAPEPAPAPRQPAAKPAVAVCLVINGQELWVGNEEHETDPAAQYPGALNALRAALTESAPGSVLPAGSQGMVVSYSTGAKVRLPFGPLDDLAGALGTQADYRGRIGTDLVQGVQLGLAELAKAEAPRRVLVVIGDGNDTNNEAARPTLQAIRESTNVEIYALVYKSAVSLEGEIIDLLTPNVTAVSAAAGFRAALADTWRRIARK